MHTTPSLSSGEVWSLDPQHSPGASLIQLFVTGDSTTGLNPPSEATGEKVSWSDRFARFVDPDRVIYRNRAFPGRSIRDFHHRNLYRSLIDEARAGDVLIACHGHLERTPLTRENDRARGSLEGDGEASVEVYDRVFHRIETVHTFGWYLRELIRQCRDREMILFLMSPPVRNSWADSAVRRTRSTEYAEIMQSVATTTSTYYLDLASATQSLLQQIGEQAAGNLYLPDDITHTNEDGANVYALLVARLLREHPSGIFARSIHLPGEEENSTTLELSINRRENE